MPDGMGEEQGTGHIWLRYATQFSVGERTYTIDMGIPVPVGADEETRERLLREADEGMDQLTRHVEERAAQVQAGLPSGSSTLSTRRPTTSTPKFTPAIATPPPSPAPGRAVAQGTGSVSPAPSASSSTPASPASPAASRPTVSPTPSPTQSVPAPSAPARESSRLSPSSQAAQSRPPTQPTKPEPAIPAASTPPAAPTSSTQKRPVVVPPTRSNIGASMPPTPGLPSGTLQLPQFLQYIQEMGLNARQAMDMLKVKSLSGLNLREALERLQHVVMSEGATTTMSAALPAPSQTQTPAQSQTQARPQGPIRTSGPKTDEGNTSATSAAPAPGGVSARQQARSGAAAPPASSPSQSQGAASGATSTGKPPVSPARSTTPAPAPPPAPRPVSPPSAAPPVPPAPPTGGAKSGPADLPKPVVIREEQTPYGFKEELDDELDDFEFDEEEDEEATMGAALGLSAANRGSAEDIVGGLRGVGGSSVVSAQRLKALHNVVDGQLPPEELQALIRGVWGVASDKKLKSEQAEALISWGKQDEFVTEAEMVLALFEEDGNARSDR